MKILKRTLLIVFVVIAVIVLSGFMYVRHLSQRAVPDYNMDLKLKGLNGPVEVYRDQYAVPHIYASDEHDLYMVTGYLLAEDRLWQMDLLRRVTEGRLSEVLTDEYVDTDLLLRALRFSEKSEKILQDADSIDRIALESFSEGVNQYIKGHGNKLPPEFAILGYKPDNWEPVHSVNMIGYMAWDLKAGWSEILLAEIQKAVDSARYADILPNLARKSSLVYPDFKLNSRKSAFLPDMLLNNALLRGLGADVFDASNNWAVSGGKSVSGKPLFANDMHLGLNIPGIWYQMHQCVPGKLNVTGVMLTNTPYVICGHNDSIAWGMTNTYVDNLDFYEEKINPVDSNQYAFQGSWENFVTKKVTIKLKDGSEVERVLRFTRHGVVVSSFRQIKDKVISMHWVGDEMSNELKTVGQLNRASNWNDFTDALKTFISVSQNVVYADKKGNIGLFCAAGIPIRKRNAVFEILPGWTDEYDWQGFVPFEELPYSYNPDREFVASANNRTVPNDYHYHIGTWYAPPSRYNRIIELLAKEQAFTVEKFKSIQLDEHSKLAEAYLPFFLKALEKATLSSNNEKLAFDMLKKWDYRMDKQSAAAIIFETTYLGFIRCTFEDEMGEALFKRFNGMSVSEIAIDQLLEKGKSPWFDDVTTPGLTEKLDDVILCSFRNTVDVLQNRLGSDPGKWEWGKVHGLLLVHPLASVNILDRVFGLNRGPYAVGGSFHTVAAKSYDWNNPYTVDHGSSQRHIYDLSDWDNSLSVIPTGNSGIPASKHYCDQTILYVNGNYHPDYFSRDKVVEHARYHQTFVGE